MSKPPFLQACGRWVRRAILKNKTLYFLLSSPKPLSDWYGFDRGTPLDRFYIESFLEKHQAHIQGICLELQDDTYTKRFGQARATKSDVLDINKNNKKATIIADLRNMTKTPPDSYDCIILTQVLQFIDLPSKALGECWRILKPGGVLLTTLPSISRIDCQSGIEEDYWRFTKAGAKVIFSTQDWKQLQIESHGNCRSGLYFLAGVSKEEASSYSLNSHDENFPLIISVFAQK